MKNQDLLPDARVYEEEMKYFPWGTLIGQVLRLVIQNVPKGASVVDLMCGPGHLLGTLRNKRPDLKLIGVDSNAKFIWHARRTYPNVQFVLADARTWNPGREFSCVICTAGLHHLPYRDQPAFIKKLTTLAEADGTVLCADPLIAPYKNERERKRNAAAFGHATLQAVLKKNPPEEIVQAAIDVLRNDVLGWEYKTSLLKLLPEFQKNFGGVGYSFTWKPEDGVQAGDCLFILHV